MIVMVVFPVKELWKLILFFQVRELIPQFLKTSASCSSKGRTRNGKEAKSRAVAFAMGLQNIDETVHVNGFSDALDDAETNESSHPEGTLSISSYTSA